MSPSPITKIKTIEANGFEIELFECIQSELRQLISGSEDVNFYINFTRKKDSDVFCSIEAIRKYVSDAFEEFENIYEERESVGDLLIVDQQIVQYMEFISQKLNDSQKSNTGIGYLLESSNMGFYRLKFSFSVIEFNSKKVHIPKLTEKLVMFQSGSSEPININL